MTLLRKLAGWWFAPPQVPIGPLRTILWWEKRRIPYNLFVGFFGVISLIVFFWAINASGTLKPGEDAEEPLAIIFAPVAINILYTLGWIVEAPIRIFIQDRFVGLGVGLMMAGMSLSLFCITLPALFWCGYLVIEVLEKL